MKECKPLFEKKREKKTEKKKQKITIVDTDSRMKTHVISKHLMIAHIYDDR